MNEATQRIDKWLWHARFVKSRSQATRLVQERRVRLNRRVVTKAATPLRPGDVLTFAQGPRVRVVRVVALAVRRGPSLEARSFYEDLAPPMAEGRGSVPGHGARDPDAHADGP